MYIPPLIDQICELLNKNNKNNENKTKQILIMIILSLN